MTHDPLKLNLDTASDKPKVHPHEVQVADAKSTSATSRERLEFDLPLVIEKDPAAILEFDEADSLFGKRSGVKDSHDRY